MSNIVLYAYNFVSRAERVLWALDELQLDYELVRLDPFAGDTMSDEFGALNPQRKIPVLVHNNKTFTDSLAIMEYLADLKPEKGLLPEDIHQRYQVRESIYFTLTEIEAYLWTADQATRLSFLYSWPEGVAEEALQRVTKALPHLQNTLADAEFIAAGRFTLADIYIGHILLWCLRGDLKLPDNLYAYCQRLSNRPAFPAIFKENNQKDC